MNNADAADALKQYEEMGRRRTLFPPLQSPPPASVWRPELTEEERAAREQYVKDHDLPF
ncbi:MULTISPECIES: hypothetical protein [unclassified Massilia]|uniref:hypothetical protein n=1 Tax=unclassified Massilia TaxID=2609279 RepID=UPI000A644260|nr:MULTISPECIES: hypothetical protein [unclassified Massilia]